MKRFFIALLVIIALFGGLIYSLKNSSNSSDDLYNVSLQQITKNMKNGALLIDVRTAEEYAKDHAVDAINLPLSDIRSGKTPTDDKNLIIYVYCHSGMRAAQAKTILEKAGYKHVISATSLYNWVSLGGKTTGTNPVCSVKNANAC